MTPTDPNSILWVYHNLQDIRWVAILDRVDLSFHLNWIEQAVEAQRSKAHSVRWLLIPSVVYNELSLLLHESVRRWLHEKLDLEVLVDDRLVIQPTLFRAVLLDEDYHVGTQLLWVRAPSKPLSVRLPTLEDRFDVIVDDLL
jgi:hypothetical protein